MNRIKIAAPTLFMVLLGCAAMVRTWDFKPAASTGERIAVEVAQAKISQRTAAIILRITNTTQNDLPFELGETHLVLPDGDYVAGKSHVLKAGWKKLKRLFGKDAAQTLPAGASIDIEVYYRQYKRDLRRHPTLTLHFENYIFAGANEDIAPIILSAPPEAPMGEHI